MRHVDGLFAVIQVKTKMEKEKGFRDQIEREGI